MIQIQISTSLAQHHLHKPSATLKVFVTKDIWIKPKAILIGGLVVVAAQEQKIGLTVFVAVPVLRFQMNAKKVYPFRTLILLPTKAASAMPSLLITT
jgi:hypothetical protein